MRRHLVAVSVLVLTVSLAGAPVVSAAPRGEGSEWDRWTNLLITFFWSGDGRVDPKFPRGDGETLADGACGDPWGRTAPAGPSCPLPPPAPAASAPEDPDF